MASEELRDLPPIDRLLSQWESELSGLPRPLLLRSLRGTLTRVRQELLDGSFSRRGTSVKAFVQNGGLREEVLAEIRRLREPRHQSLINATGVLLHTGLGRAPLSDSAVDAVARIARYGLVEIDPVSGVRGRRELFVRDLLTDLTLAEEATVVNNNAGAVMLMLAALAKGREVIVSRGELVEIGGGFRVPEVMVQSGAVLVEVGTTNRTRLQDYEAAIRPETAMLLQVHPSNFKVIGFTEAPPLVDLVNLGQARGLMVCSDLGSGYLRRYSGLEFLQEPTVQETLASGADVVCFSGDKMLGGPQSGILIGKSEPVLRIRRHPQFRALRPDKMTLAALEATLIAHRESGEDPPLSIPFFQQLTASLDTLRWRASRVVDSVRASLGTDSPLLLAVVDSLAQVGSGSVPGLQFPSIALSIPAPGSMADRLAEWLRVGSPRVFCRVSEGHVFLDLRTVFEEEDEALIGALKALAQRARADRPA